MIKKTNYIKGGYNCAETIIHAYNENHGTEIPVSLGSGMGGGATIGSLCGAINASLIIIGMTKGRSLPTDENKAKEISNTLLKKIKEHYGSELCIDLKKSGVSCSDIVEFTYSELEKLI